MKEIIIVIVVIIIFAFLIFQAYQFGWKVGKNVAEYHHQKQCSKCHRDGVCNID